ncbi:hypothetical protein [Caballeronia sordidicola]|uniref:hypothetical protein n=1 Tax=Caballeronia sordidicola TaxID=196367 RepID=UPI000B78852E|nr:hypothetical protein [Caballeronia sordidicola]
MAATDRITMSMRELDRFKVIEAVVRRSETIRFALSTPYPHSFAPPGRRPYMTAPAKTHQPASVYLSSAGSECFELDASDVLRKSLRVVERMDAKNGAPIGALRRWASPT